MSLVTLAKKFNLAVVTGLTFILPFASEITTLLGVKLDNLFISSKDAVISLDV